MGGGIASRLEDAAPVAAVNDERADALVRRKSGGLAMVDGCAAAWQGLLRLHLGHLDYEVIGLVHLDSHRRLLAIEDLFRGTLMAAQVHPREVVKSALAHNAMYVIAYHNHPSRIPEPSPAADFIARRMKDALRWWTSP